MFYTFSRTPSLPEGWLELFVATMPQDGVFALCIPSVKRILYWVKWFLYPFYWFLTRHERGHAWGIDKCLGDHKWCIMAEDDDTWMGKVKLLPIQAIGLGQYCPHCKAYLEAEGAFDGS